jgi:hypothetical protein
LFSVTILTWFDVGLTRVLWFAGNLQVESVSGPTGLRHALIQLNAGKTAQFGAQ